MIWIIYLYGVLGDVFGCEFFMVVEMLVEVVCVFCMMIKGFEVYVCEGLY